MIDEGIVSIKLKKLFFIFYDTMAEVCRVIATTKLIELYLNHFHLLLMYY